MKKDLVKSVITISLVATLVIVVLFGTFVGSLDNDVKTLFVASVSSVISFYIGFQANKNDKQA